MTRIVVVFVLAIGGLACGDQPRTSGEATVSAENASREGAARTDSSRKDKWKKNATYDLMVRWNDVYASYEITLNGFPLWVQGFKGRAAQNEFDVPLNTALVGEGNRIAVRMEPRLRATGEVLQVAEIDWQAWVRGHFDKRVKEISPGKVDSAYEAWVGQAREQWADYRSRVGEGAIGSERAMDSMRAWASRHPMTVRVRFDNEHGPDFSRVFEEAPRLEDTPATRRRLKDYAMRLRELFEQKSTAEVYIEYKVRFQSIDFSEEKAMRTIRENWFGIGWWTNFSREDVGMQRWAGGRVWELYRRDEEARQTGKQALFYVGERTLRSYHEVYVAEIDGELKVVR